MPNRSWWKTFSFLLVCSALAWLPLTAFVHRFNSPAYVERVSHTVPVVQLESEHFILKYPQGYMPEPQLVGFLTHAEEIRSELLAFLQPPPQPEEKKITVILVDGPGISRTAGPGLILLYYVREGISPLAHEVTHLLMGVSPWRFLREGLAVYAQEHFGDLAFPNLFRPVNLATLAEFRRGLFLSLTDLQKDFYFSGETRRLAYLEAGSFTKYLINHYSYNKFREVYYTADYLSVYGKSLSELEREWLSSLRWLNLLASDIHLMTGLLCLGMISVGLTRKTLLWWLLVAVASLAVAVFDLYLYQRFPSQLALGLLVAALLTVPLSKKVAMKWLQRMLWACGGALLAYYVLLPTVRAAQVLGAL